MKVEYLGKSWTVEDQGGPGSIAFRLRNESLALDIYYGTEAYDEVKEQVDQQSDA